MVFLYPFVVFEALVFRNENTATPNEKPGKAYVLEALTEIPTQPRSHASFCCEASSFGYRPKGPLSYSPASGTCVQHQSRSFSHDVAQGQPPSGGSAVADIFYTYLLYLFFRLSLTRIPRSLCTDLLSCGFDADARNATRTAGNPEVQVRAGQGPRCQDERAAQVSTILKKRTSVGEYIRERVSEREKRGGREGKGETQDN